MKRRDFIQMSGLASASLLAPGFLAALDRRDHGITGGRKLVVIQLSGGLDGLSAAIPYRNDIYYSNRPVLAVPTGSVLRLDDDMGLHPVMTGLKSIYDDGFMTLINNVGYPNANRSHFRSMDIWHTASGSDKYWKSGWLGRYLDSACTKQVHGAPCAAHLGLEIDDTLSLAMKGAEQNGMAVKDIRMLHETIQTGRVMELQELIGEAPNTANASLDYLYKTLVSTTGSIDYLRDQSRIYRSTQEYPKNAFGKQLKSIAELIISGVDSKVFYSSLSGFDTHAGQRGTLNRLLGQFSAGVHAMVTDLKSNHRLDEVIILVFSEFGRRVKENGSGGTDHGAGSNIYLIGSQLKQPGVFNGPTDLTNLDQGDVPSNVDFRRIYAELLKKWMGADDTKILKRSYNHLGLIA